VVIVMEAWRAGFVVGHVHHWNHHAPLPLPLCLLTLASCRPNSAESGLARRRRWELERARHDAADSPAERVEREGPRRAVAMGGRLGRGSGVRAARRLGGPLLERSGVEVVQARVPVQRAAFEPFVLITRETTGQGRAKRRAQGRSLLQESAGCCKEGAGTAQYACRTCRCYQSVQPKRWRAPVQIDWSG
jgi:hypothetical protein